MWEFYFPQTVKKLEGLAGECFIFFRWWSRLKTGSKSIPHSYARRSRFAWTLYRKESGSFDVTRDDSERRFLAQHRVLQCWNDIVIMRNNVATLCCAKNRPCESPRVTSPLKGLYGTSLPNLPLNTCQAGHTSWSRKLVTHYTSSLSPNFTYRTGTYVHNCKFTRGNQTTLQSIYSFA